MFIIVHFIFFRSNFFANRILDERGVSFFMGFIRVILPFVYSWNDVLLTWISGGLWHMCIVKRGKLVLLSLYTVVQWLKHSGRRWKIKLLRKHYTFSKDFEMSLSTEYSNGTFLVKSIFHLYGEIIIYAPINQ